MGKSGFYVSLEVAQFYPSAVAYYVRRFHLLQPYIKFVP